MLTRFRKYKKCQKMRFSLKWTPICLPFIGGFHPPSRLLFKGSDHPSSPHSTAAHHRAPPSLLPYVRYNFFPTTSCFQWAKSHRCRNHKPRIAANGIALTSFQWITIIPKSLFPTPIDTIYNLVKPLCPKSLH